MDWRARIEKIKGRDFKNTAFGKLFRRTRVTDGSAGWKERLGYVHPMDHEDWPGRSRMEVLEEEHGKGVREEYRRRQDAKN